MCKIIAVNNNKGGVLKTSMVGNLAGVLSSKGKKVLLIDTDNQSNLAISFGINPDTIESSLYDVLVNDTPPENVAISINENVDLIPSNLDLISFDFDILTNNEIKQRFAIMKEKLDWLRDVYDYIIIDTPPALSLINFNVFSFADHVLIPFEPEAFAMRSLKAIHKTLNDFKTINPSLSVLGVTFTKVVFNSNLHRDVIESTKEFAAENGFDCLETNVKRTVEYANAIGYNRLPLTFVKPNSERSKVYFDLWNEIEVKLMEGVSNE